MPVSKEAAERFFAALDAAGPNERKRMFGGWGLYVDGVFMGLIDDDRLYFKVDEETEGWYERRGREPWVWNGRPGPYREVPEESLADSVELARLMAEARNAAIRRKAGSNRSRSQKRG